MAGRDLWSSLVLDCVPHQGENEGFEPGVARNPRLVSWIEIRDIGY